MTPKPRQLVANGSTRVARLVDVADAAGVSVSTAGRVLRGSSLPVAAAVAERVQEEARRLGYVPNVLARSLRGAQPRMVGLVIGDMLDPYYGVIAEAVTERAETEHAMLAIVCNMQRDPLLELKYCRQLWEHRVAGLILSGGGFDQHRCAKELASLTRDMHAAGVVVTTLGPRFLDAPVFSPDNEEVGRVAAHHLLAAGHRRIAIVTGPSRSETAQQRLAGSLAALAERGAESTVHHAQFSTDAVAAELAALMARRPDITGILAGSDFMARVVIEWLTARGVPVPQQISVVGIGGTAWAERSPRLTTVDIRLAECSRAALDYIATRSTGKAAKAPHFSPSVVAGETVARAVRQSPLRKK